MIEKLKELYADVDKLNEEIPSELSKKIFLYAQILQLVGKYHADSTREYKKAYSERKRSWGDAIVSGKGTGVEKQGKAELECYQFRKLEADAESEMTRWKNSFLATTEIINALKIQLKTLMTEYTNSG